MDSRIAEMAEKAAEFLDSCRREILVISHYDCDGISSAVIANQMLERAGKDFVQVFVDEITEEKLEEVLDENGQEVVLFTDIGSGQLDTVTELTEEREVVIADHHEVEESDEDVSFHVNPMLIEEGEVIDGGTEVSGAGVTYLVASSMSEDNQDLLKYALLGATGDIQKKDNEFTGLNREFLEEARENDLIEVKNGLMLYGRRSKSLVRALKYTTEPYMEGISNDESGTVQFLRKTGIDIRDDGDFRSLADLSEAEEKKLIHGLIERGYEGVQQLIGTVYVMNNGWEIQEFSSLMNACGKLDKPKKALDICIDGDFELAWDIKKEYGRKISQYLSMIRRKKDDPSFVREMEFGQMITAGEKINPNMIGTVSTICTKSDILEGPVVMGIAVKEEDFYKVSVRVKEEYEDEVELNTLMEESCEKVGGKGGGHKMAAGGKIPREERDRFINIIENSLKQIKE